MKRIGILSVAVVASVIALPSFGEEVKGVMRDDVNHYALSYAEKEKMAELTVREANDMFNNKYFFNARDLYIKAKSLFSELNKNYFKDQIQFCMTQIEQCYYQLALEAIAKADKSLSVNDFDEAIKLCTEAKEYYPESAAVMDKKIAYFQELKKKSIIKAETGTDALIPDKETLDYEVQVLMRRGREYYNAGLYSKAKRVYEDVLLINPYNADALQNLQAVNVCISRAGEMRSTLSHNRNVLANELEWALPIQTVKDRTVAVLETPVEKGVFENSIMLNKIKNIIIPQVDFNEVSLRSAIETLVALSIQNDKTEVTGENGQTTGRGINIFLREDLFKTAPVAGEGDMMGGDGGDLGAVPGGNENEFGTDEGANVAITDESDEEEEEYDDEANYTELEKTVLRVHLVKNRSIEDILKLICTSANLRYRVEQYAVVLEPLDMPESGMETKIFPVDAAAFGDIDPSNPAELKEFFENECRVTFPSGSSVVFDPRISRVIAYNTLDNLQLIEEVCDEGMNKQEPMVQIQLRFVEVSQDDLNGLGFDYSVTDTSSDPAFSSPITSNLNPVGNTSMAALFNAGDFNFQITANAVSQLTSADTLASPRVTTVPGKEVTIRLTREVYFVEDFEESEREENSGRYIFTSAFPNFESDAEELGIKFTVLPSIDDERRLISMHLTPEFNTLIGWTEYDNGEELLRSPILSTRSIDTHVTVSDGETLVLGGVVEDLVGTTKRKVPILGDIPFIGRFFQSRSEQSEKKSLLIFVTPRLINPDGKLRYPDVRTANKGVVKFF